MNLPMYVLFTMGVRMLPAAARRSTCTGTGLLPSLLHQLTLLLPHPWSPTAYIYSVPAHWRTENTALSAGLVCSTLTTKDTSTNPFNLLQPSRTKASAYPATAPITGCLSPHLLTRHILPINTFSIKMVSIWKDWRISTILQRAGLPVGMKLLHRCPRSPLHIRLNAVAMVSLVRYCTKSRIGTYLHPPMQPLMLLATRPLTALPFTSKRAMLLLTCLLILAPRESTRLCSPC
mmetsp:Transcript_2957/g.4937  ORF Transcript_2957/g.4937 Transcript_2957/m.4937 type:complete len:233 (+) Transcript_2957:301-999(+)